jgi:hypothetical protein
VGSWCILCLGANVELNVREDDHAVDALLISLPVNGTVYTTHCVGGGGRQKEGEIECCERDCVQVLCDNVTSVS